MCLWCTIVGQDEDGLPAVGEVIRALTAVTAFAGNSLCTASHFRTRLEQPEGGGGGGVRLSWTYLTKNMKLHVHCCAYHLCVSHLHVCYRGLYVDLLLFTYYKLVLVPHVRTFVHTCLSLCTCLLFTPCKHVCCCAYKVVCATHLESASRRAFAENTSLNWFLLTPTSHGLTGPTGNIHYTTYWSHDLTYWSHDL